MSQLTQLQKATSLNEVAQLLGFKPSGLSYILYKKSVASKYRQFTIPKKFGGERMISAPSDDLKKLQSRLAELLMQCSSEINASMQHKFPVAHGFVKNRSIITNAKVHRARRFVFNVDLSNFFGSINFGRVRGFFIKDKNFSLNEKVATILAQIACVNNCLPQGSPCSPVISNLIGHILDVRLVKLSIKNGCSYSRYADDLTFSTNDRSFPSDLATSSLEDIHDWIPGAELAKIVLACGFFINEKKTRMQYQDSRQDVTGLIVNRKVNVRREYRHLVRAMSHTYATSGRYVHKIAAKNSENEYVEKLVEGTANQLQGMFAFIDQIDLYNYNIAKKLGTIEADRQLTAKRARYQQFLLYKEFYAGDRPVIVCEGKTDNVYLVHAIRSLCAHHPSLAQKNADGTIQLLVRLFRYAETKAGRILGIESGGSTNLLNLIKKYRTESKFFQSTGIRQPLVILLDNDSGADTVLAYLVKTGVAANRSDSFIHVSGNLYIVLTPLGPGGTPTMIESFFDSIITEKKIDGKKFNPGNKIDAKTEYGKAVFAHKVVVADAEKINFAAFGNLLINIERAIEDFAMHQYKH